MGCYLMERPPFSWGGYKVKAKVTAEIADGETPFVGWLQGAAERLLSSTVIGVAAANGKTNRKRRSTPARRTCAAVAGDPDVVARRRHHSGDRPSLRPRRIPAAAIASVLVPVVRRGHGHGLAFVRHHHQRHRRPQARPGTALRRTRHPCVRWPRPAFKEDAGRVASARRTHRLRWR